MASRLILVKIAHDDEADRWYVEQSSLAGLSAEAATADDLMKRIPAMVADLIEENGFEDGGDASEVPLEIIASQASRVRLRETA